MLVIWMTLNPNNLKSKLVLTLAKVHYEINSKTTTNIHVAIAIINPVAVEQFFSTICKNIFDHLLAV